MLRPQVIRVFLPITTPGTEARLKPDTSNGHALVMLRQCSPTWAKVDGMEVARCGSFPSIALPDAVRAPDTAQEFDPACPSNCEPGTCGMAVSILVSSDRAALAPWSSARLRPMGRSGPTSALPWDRTPCRRWFLG